VLARLGIELIPAYSPEARGRSEPMFGTLQKRLPQELRVAGITTMEAADRSLQNVYLPRHNAAFARTPEDAGSAFVPFAGPPRRHPLRSGGAGRRQRYKNRVLQIPADRHRHHYVKPNLNSGVKKIVL
jgi:hypothetical protein